MGFLKKVLILVVMIVLTSWFFKTFANESKCSSNPVFCQIIKNEPTINKNYALRLSNIISKVSKQYGIPAKIFTAILMQESRYKLEAKGCHVGIRSLNTLELVEELAACVKKPNIVKYSRCMFATKEKTKVDRVCSDLGISQIYVRTAEKFNFDLYSLTNDLEYSVEAGAIVLADFHKRYANKETTWWTRYNSSSPDKRDLYKKMVERYIH
jgi:hypothetical protein